MNPIKIVYEGGEGEIVEKKSRFIATVKPVESQGEALDFIAAMKKKYWDATHNCFAFVIGENQELQRCSDDGEPQGTAGRPMLDVLLGEGIHNGAVVVTRYFGGTLLGTGGLVRAYSRSVQEGLKNSRIVEKRQGFLLRMRTDYGGIGKIQYLLGQRDLRITDSSYTDVVEVETLVGQEKIEELKAAVTEGTSGRTAFVKEEKVCFAFLEGEPILFEP
ncbi:MAG TPA: YigZ family protein [Candidatus Merdiplasma excrementigallinarum]|uniref:YigZ family protein n=1 Tax=Candidatus Merdiplasma excrementigallinarum TaxID=2840864 RepID=A0A9D1T9U7_9FIRM|nr:YigZ family protein [Candidatus Merdiplasma excrementigallinarum]